jgi:hypothetical protein
MKNEIMIELAHLRGQIELLRTEILSLRVELQSIKINFPTPLGPRQPYPIYPQGPWPWSETTIWCGPTTAETV